MPSCAIVSVQKHYCQLCNSQCKNVSIICASVNTRTLLSGVQQSVSARTLLSAVQVSMQEHYCQLCKCPCKNTTVSCASVHARTLLSAVQNSANARTFYFWFRSAVIQYNTIQILIYTNKCKCYYKLISHKQLLLNKSKNLQVIIIMMAVLSLDMCTHTHNVLQAASVFNFR